MNTSKQRLMILGSLDEFTALVRSARARGIYTIVCDGYPDGPAKKEADAAYNIDVRQIDTIAKLCIREQVDNIITSFSDLLFECMVKIADKAGLPCYLKPEQLSYYRDKSVMKQLFKELGIPSPRHVRLDQHFSDNMLTGFSFPVVTKPLDMYGSRGIFVLDDIAQIRQFFDQACESSPLNEILVEEYNTGWEFNMMTWVLDGQIQVLSIADREKTITEGHDIPYSSRNIYPSRLMEHVYDDARQILNTFIKKTRQTSGPLSMQFFWKPDSGIQVCEIAGRFFGYEHELLEYCSGLSIEELLLDWAYNAAVLKNRLTAHSPFFTTHSAVLYFQAKNGIIDDQSAAAAIASRESVKTMQLFYQEGDTVTPHGPKPYTARCCITAATRTALDHETGEICKRLSIQDPSGEELLFQNQIMTYPD